MSSHALLPLLALLLATPARAELRFFVAAPKNFLVNEAQVFRPRGAPLPLDGLLKRAVHQVQVQLGKKAYAQVANARELSHQLSSRKEYGDGLLLGREWLNLGREHYESLRVDEAVVDLRRAEEIYLKVLRDIAEPFGLAQVHLLQGLCYVEKGLKGRSHIAFRRMFFFDPWIRFDPGYHPGHAEEQLRASVVDFGETFDKGDPFLGMSRLRAFFKAYPFDYFVYLYLDDEGDGPSLILRLFEQGRDDPVLDERILVQGEEGATLFALDATLARWLSCLNLEPEDHPDDDRGRLGFVVTTNHSTYFSTPTRAYFYNFGYGIGSFYELTPNLDLYVMSELYTSILDSYRDLRESFNTVRALVGVGFTFGPPRVRAFIYPALDVHYLGGFRTVTDPRCKLYGEDAAVCDQDSISTLDLDLLIGANLAFGARFFVTEHVFLQVSAAISTYFVPFTGASVLNFPFSGALGLGYRL